MPWTYSLYFISQKANNSWGLCVFRNLDNFILSLMRMTYLTFHAVVKSGFRSSRVRVTSINSKIKRRHIKNKQSYAVKAGFSLRPLFYFMYIARIILTYVPHVIVISVIGIPCSKLSRTRLSSRFSSTYNKCNFLQS